VQRAVEQSHVLLAANFSMNSLEGGPPDQGSPPPRMSQDQNNLLSHMDKLLSRRLATFEEKIERTQKELAEMQSTKISSLSGLTHKFNKKGNEEQFKINVSILEKVESAHGKLQVPTAESVASASEDLGKGMAVLRHRQKLIKLADSSELGWGLVAEYETNELADDSDDEKRIQRSEFRAKNKAKDRLKKRSNRFSARPTPYPSAAQSGFQRDMQRPQYSSGFRQQGFAISTATGRRPGLCFACFKPGHWRAECRATNQAGGSESGVGGASGVPAPMQLSIERVSVRFMESMDENVSPISPVGRLKCAYGAWVDAGANAHILDVVQNGYKLPLYECPSPVLLKNNKSALDNGVFVQEQIAKLLELRCISEVDKPPEIVNPLTVAQGKSGKQRLVLDCRHVNPHLYKFKCKFEDVSVGRDLFQKGDFLFVFDLKSAYHHIEIFPDHRKYLGFSWVCDGQVKYYVYNVLPFGISTAGYIFTKVLRVLVKRWREQGIPVVMFLDDGISGARDYINSKLYSRMVKLDLEDFGFLLAEDKCQWEPTQDVVWLGYAWCMLSGVIRVTHERVTKLLEAIDQLIARATRQECVIPVRQLASIVGMVISMQSAMGAVVRLRTRSMYRCVLDRASWNAPVIVDERARRELVFWKENVQTLNGQAIRTVVDHSSIVYSDASQTGFGGYVALRDDCQVSGQWSMVETVKSSTWR
jgi:hypothetical protein